jgi:Ca2+-binding EF-hand superfamily protein
LILYNTFNKDGNGYITIDEFKETLPLEVDSSENWVEIVSEVDKDGDGMVNNIYIRFHLMNLNQ